LGGSYYELWDYITLGMKAGDGNPSSRRLSPKGGVINKAEYRKHVWSYDFLEEHTVRGKRIRILAVMDEFTRECLALMADRSITLDKVIDLLD
jgi:hypothetical protein